VTSKITIGQRARRFLILIAALLLFTPPAHYTNVNAATPGSVIINEIAWMGTQADANDEWIELYNTTDQPVDLTNWKLIAADSTPNITLSGIVPAYGFFLLERTDDSSVNDISADKIYSGALSNSSEILFLKDLTGSIIDSANGNGGSWPAGANPSPAGRATMERIDPQAPDSDANWATNSGVIRNGLDANNNSLSGTPKAQNSTVNLPPVADAGPDQMANEGTATTLDGSASSDPNDDSLACTWEPGDGTGMLSGCTVAHTYVDNGVFTAALTVEDAHGGMSSDSTQVTIHNVAPSVNGGPDQTATTDQAISFSGSFNDSGTADTHTVQWDFGDGQSTHGTLNPTHSYSDADVYTVTLTITDDDGGVGVATFKITVSKSVLLGDADGNEKIDFRDVVLCAEIALDLRVLTFRAQIACDVAAPFAVLDGRDVVRIAEMISR